MKPISGLAVLGASLAITGLVALFKTSLADDEGQTRFDLAKFTDSGDLKRPADLDDWVFLGASIGMGYNDGEFDPNSPGMFQIVVMEPNAYAYFREHHDYADGSMLALLFYDPVKRLANNRNGFVMGDFIDFEIHIKDSANFDKGHAFYGFEKATDQTAAYIPTEAPCYECHLKDGAFEGTFAQFYPEIRTRIPKEMLERVLKMGDVHPNH